MADKITLPVGSVHRANVSDDGQGTILDLIQPDVLHVGTTNEDLKDALREFYYEPRGCGCAHDCCGCWFGGAMDFTPTGEGAFLVALSYSRNY